jgi:hypothetical protein
MNSVNDSNKSSRNAAMLFVSVAPVYLPFVLHEANAVAITGNSQQVTLTLTDAGINYFNNCEYRNLIKHYFNYTVDGNVITFTPVEQHADCI